MGRRNLNIPTGSVMYWNAKDFVVSSPKGIMPLWKQYLLKADLLLLFVVTFSPVGSSLSEHWFPWPPGADFSTTKPYLVVVKETRSVYLALCPRLRLEGVNACPHWQPAEHREAWNQSPPPVHILLSGEIHTMSFSRSRARTDPKWVLTVTWLLESTCRLRPEMFSLSGCEQC